MADDVSNLLHFCRTCGDYFTIREGARKHYLDEHTNAEHDEHRNKLSTEELDTRLVTQSPEWREYDFDGWRTKVLDWANDEPGKDYRDFTGEHDIPSGYVIRLMEEEGLFPKPRVGVSNTPLTWDELSESAQASVLADVYFPDQSHNQIADSVVGGADEQSSISAAVRKYGWMLNHPDIDTPVSPWEPTKSEEGEITWEFDAESGPVAQPAESETETGERAADVAAEIMETPTKSEEPDSPGATPRVDGEKMAIHGPGEAFEIVAALIESERYERARAIVERIYERN